MDDKKMLSPDHAAQELAANPDKASAASDNHKVCLGPKGNGWFELSWSASNIGTYDWVGLYSSDSVPDSDYIGGDNWQWATNGNSYSTNTGVQEGFQARYLVWNAVTGAYASVARSPTFPGRQCS